jgi:outer membrane protein TolC
MRRWMRRRVRARPARANDDSRRFILLKALVFALAAFTAGCASFSPDGGFGTVDSAARARVRELLGRPLSPEDAVRIALVNNPALQAGYAEIGLSEADLVEASRPKGPRLSFARLVRGDERTIERGVFFDVLGLFAIPLSTRAEEQRFAAARSRAAGEALKLALETRKAYFGALAAEEALRYAEQVREAAEVGAELARRMAAAGNWSKLGEARERAFHAEAGAQFARAKQRRVAAHERLLRALALVPTDMALLRLPERLPALPAAAREQRELEAQALAARLDVQSARSETEALAKSLGLAKATGWLNLLEVGYRHNDERGHAGGQHERGWEIELSIPLFDFGVREKRAELRYQQAVNRAADTALRARSEVRESYAGYRSAFDAARLYRDELVPLRKRISEEMLLRYNGMLASVFELLADTRESVAAVHAYIEALRDFWIAESELQMALTGGSPGPAEEAR